EALHGLPHRPHAEGHAVLPQQPGPGLRQRPAGMQPDMLGQRCLLSRRQLAPPVPTSRVRPAVTRHTTSDQRFIDIRNTHPEDRCDLPNRLTTINCPQNPVPQILRIALPRSPVHRAASLPAAPYESHATVKGNPQKIPGNMKMLYVRDVLAPTLKPGDVV